MRHLLLPLLLLATPAFAQDNGLPPAQVAAPANDIQAVLAPVDAVFAGLAAHDPEQIRPHILDGATITIAESLPDGSHAVHRLTFADWLGRLEGATGNFLERMPNPAVEIDGDIAMVWGFYTFHLNGQFSHCGVDHFSLVRQDGEWKIADLTYSTRRTDCGQ
ncbi:nuclear transport factor 2 family protein [Stakelama tenebrarum]|uniref:Nuclear transport factor 2 family protein n=1 Tax=Stakelama tenebrarum TaxID=2711215 RepID=A0A6G6Y7D5_9SPHN|nr:nuclear transport factor 2 family protein [Sphingosinithalassobacter tenebrarum]QIG80707.1 nuclear transport factor 2 family protein [Sphingosinithalassobacter tenebrarum]